jgi:hypothetical protein
MTNRWLSLLLLALVATATPAAGQKGKSKGRKATAPVTAEYKPTVDQYTVVQGDTLWDVCARLTGSPWHWPRVWSYNPELTNPHWIYPGDVVRFEPSTLPLPRLAQLASSERDLPPEPGAATEIGREADSGETLPQVSEVRATPLGATTSQRRSRRPLSLFVSPRELAESGRLTNSVNDQILLAPPAEVFITFPSGAHASPGQRFMIYKTDLEIMHPITGKSYGYLTQVTGFASLRTREGNDLGRAVITEAVAEVERGQLVAPLVQLPLVDQVPTLARTPVGGYVLAVQPGESMAGERQFVFVDIGAGKGLEPGNRLAVFVSEDPLDPGHEIPSTKIGELMALDVRESATTCIVLDALQEIYPGQRVKAVLH